jgi:hypothetical protein
MITPTPLNSQQSIAQPLRSSIQIPVLIVSGLSRPHHLVVNGSRYGAGDAIPVPPSVTSSPKFNLSNNVVGLKPLRFSNANRGLSPFVGNLPLTTNVLLCFSSIIVTSSWPSCLGMPLCCSIVVELGEPKNRIWSAVCMSATTEFWTPLDIKKLR